jgi:hypothetical protein
MLVYPRHRALEAVPSSSSGVRRELPEAGGLPECVREPSPLRFSHFLPITILYMNLSGEYDRFDACSNDSRILGTNIAVTKAFSNLREQPPKIGFRGEAHNSIGVQEGQPYKPIA